MKKLTLPAIATVLLMAAICVTYAQRQQRPPGGQMMMQALPLEALWAQVSFELGVNDEILPEIRAIMQDTWNGRKKLLEKAQSVRDDSEAMQGIISEMEKLRGDLDRKLQDVLSPDQMNKLTKWEEEARKAQSQMRRPPGAPQSGGGRRR